MRIRSLNDRAVDAANRFRKAASLAELHLTEGDLRSEVMEAPHRPPSSLPLGWMAVYAFFLGGNCLKVGKAGPDSGPRYTTHHYFTTAPSTLAKSIIQWESRHRLLGCQPDPKSWITSHLSRVNYLMPGSFGTVALNFLEAFMQLEFQPGFEGGGSPDPKVFEMCA